MTRKWNGYKININHNALAVFPVQTRNFATPRSNKYQILLLNSIIKTASSL